jgi:hypothetical protein
MFTKRLSRQPRSRSANICAVNICARALQSCFALCIVVPSIGADPVLAADKAAASERLTAADRQAIEGTIRQQLDAFGRDDAERAFGFATPDIQRMFGSSDSFMRMVRDNYEPVYRSTGIQFERLTRAASSSGGEWVQTVRLTDDEGKVWRAFFTVRRQADRGWKVGGCQLQETSALSI